MKKITEKEEEEREREREREEKRERERERESARERVCDLIEEKDRDEGTKSWLRGRQRLLRSCGKRSSVTDFP